MKVSICLKSLISIVLCTILFQGNLKASSSSDSEIDWGDEEEKNSKQQTVTTPPNEIRPVQAFQAFKGPLHLDDLDYLASSADDESYASSDDALQDDLKVPTKSKKYKESKKVESESGESSAEDIVTTGDERDFSDDYSPTKKYPLEALEAEDTPPKIIMSVNSGTLVGAIKVLVVLSEIESAIQKNMGEVVDVMGGHGPTAFIPGLMAISDDKAKEEGKTKLSATEILDKLVKDIEKILGKKPPNEGSNYSNKGMKKFLDELAGKKSTLNDLCIPVEIIGALPNKSPFYFRSFNPNGQRSATTYNLSDVLMGVGLVKHHFEPFQIKSTAQSGRIFSIESIDVSASDLSGKTYAYAQKIFGRRPAVLLSLGTSEKSASKQQVALETHTMKQLLGKTYYFNIDPGKGKDMPKFHIKPEDIVRIKDQATTAFLGSGKLDQLLLQLKDFEAVHLNNNTEKDGQIYGRLKAMYRGNIECYTPDFLRLLAILDPENWDPSKDFHESKERNQAGFYFNVPPILTGTQQTSPQKIQTGLHRRTQSASQSGKSNKPRQRSSMTDFENEKSKELNRQRRLGSYESLPDSKVPSKIKKHRSFDDQNKYKKKG